MTPDMTTASSLRAAKKALRKQMATKLSSVSASSIRQQSESVTFLVLNHPAYKQSKNISVYLSMPTGEINTLTIANDILSSGKELYVPFWDLSAGPQMDMVKIIDKQDLQTLPLDKWGIPSPKAEYGDPPMRRETAPDDTKLDLILVPGVAFDAARRRLGHGKGYYDRFITRCNDHSTEQKGSRPVLMALALREQILNNETVPVAEHDWTMDFLVHQDGIIGE